MVTISRLVAELDNDPDFVNRQIWANVGMATCNFCDKQESAGYSIKREEINFCTECGYNLVLFLIDHGYKDYSYCKYMDDLFHEYLSRSAVLGRYIETYNKN
jgi:hypothetical protein